MRTPIIIIAFALGTLACKAHEPSYVGSGESPDAWGQSGEQAAQGQDVKDMVKDPPYGQMVTVKGEVEKLYGKRMFTMNAGLFENDLLVISEEDIQIMDPDEVQVEGTVEKMVVAEVEEKYDLTFDNAVKIAYEGRPYMIAKSIRRVPEGENELFDGDGRVFDDQDDGVFDEGDRPNQPEN